MPSLPLHTFLLLGALFVLVEGGNKTAASTASTARRDQAIRTGQVQNITITHEHIGTRWDDAGGSAIDREIASDDGPVQLKEAMLVLMTVAGSVIFGGAAAVACCWQNRERGWSSAAKYKQVKEGEVNPYKGQGAQWLETPV
mmetsp:Transcript_10403/g.16315  ORF Transcript_10403/g.16315 Transcript_10403/m.16315 type:complete len:142 (-) Transcript_10403:165-590(-)